MVGICTFIKDKIFKDDFQHSQSFFKRITFTDSAFSWTRLRKYLRVIIHYVLSSWLASQTIVKLAISILKGCCMHVVRLHLDISGEFLVVVLVSVVSLAQIDFFERMSKMIFNCINTLLLKILIFYLRIKCLSV